MTKEQTTYKENKGTLKTKEQTTYKENKDT